MADNKKGIIYAIISAIAFSIGGLFIKLIPWGTFSIISGRCVFSSIFIIAFFIATKQKLVINKTTIFGAVLVILNMVTYVMANKLTTAANTIILEYTAPIYIIIFSMIFFKQRPTKLKIFTVIFVLLGIVLVMLGSINKGHWLGNLIAELNGIIYGLSMMNNSFKNGDALSSTLMGHVMCILVGFPSLISENDFSINVIVLVVVLGVLQSGLGYLMTSLATRLIDPLTVSIISFIEPILNPIWVLIFYDESLSVISIIGIVVVLSAIFIYNYQVSKLARGEN